MARDQSNPSVSILILHFKGAMMLRDCAASLKPLAGPGVEIIVVDNGSAENVRQDLAGLDFAKVIRSETNLGFAGGNNFGLKHCTGDYVLLLNNDMILNGDFLAPLRDYLDAHPKVGAVQGKMILPRHNNTLDVCGSFITWLGFPYHYGYFKPDGPKYQRPHRVFSGKGACLMFRRELIPKIGGFLFDEDFFAYYEEADFCHRVWLAGFEVHFVPSPPVAHLMGVTSDANPQQGFTLRRYLRNMMFSLLSNLSWPWMFRILPFYFAMMFGSMAMSAVTFKKIQFLAHLGAFTHCFKNFGKIRARRRLVKSFRKASDREIFSKALRNPRLEYFIKTFTGKIGDYVDEEIS